MRKSLIPIIFILLIVLSAPSLQAVSAIYDVDKDGDIDINDCHDVFNHIGSTSATYDVDENGITTINDVYDVWSNIGEIPDGNPPEGSNPIIDWITDIIYG